MNFVTHALSSVAFWGYTLTVAGILAASWGILFWYQRRGQRLDEYRRVFWSWLLFAGLVSGAVLLGQEAFSLVVALVTLLACKEFARATGLYDDWIFTGLVYLAILAVNLVAVWPGYDVFMATPIYAVAALCLLPVLRDRAEGMLQRVALSVMAFVYFGYFLAHLSLLAGLAAPEVYGYVLFLLYGTATADLAGWLVGRRFGRHPAAPHISPDLTWEGAGASLAWAVLWSFLLGWWTFPGPYFVWLAMPLAAVLFGVIGPLGDLVMHYILRDLGLKPWTEGTPFVSYLALGHLHRLIFVAPLFFRLVHYAPSSP